jgi:hypothetical protein
MNNKLVGIVVFMLLIFTAISVVGTLNEREIKIDPQRSDNPFYNPTTSQSINTINQGGIFIQLPPNPHAPNYASWVSSSNGGWYCYEDFVGVTGQICDIHWWGTALFYDNGIWSQGNPEGMVFNISFWDGAGSFITSYENVEPKITNTSIGYYVTSSDFNKTLYYFETDLDPCFERASGWIGIHCTYSPDDSWFLWMRSWDGNNKLLQEDEEGSGTYWGQDLSVVFTDGEPSSPVLECDGGLSLTKVVPGSTVTGSFKIRNVGDPNSVLQWRLNNLTPPSWGSNWTVIPIADFQTPEMDWLTVNFSFTAPEEENTEFTYTGKIVNAIDPSEYCEIDIYIKTPRTRSYQNKLLMQMFERFPNAFPILRQLFWI